MSKFGSMMHEELDPDITSGVGDPTSPIYRKLLTAEEEKLVDDKGNLVARLKPWSEVGTGLYLTVALHIKSRAVTQFPTGAPKAQVDMDLSNTLNQTGRWTMSFLVTEGKPRFTHATVGLAIELPDDLGTDDIKRQYLVEWIANTARESLHDRKLTCRDDSRVQLSFALADAANACVRTVL